MTGGRWHAGRAGFSCGAGGAGAVLPGDRAPSGCALTPPKAARPSPGPPPRPPGVGSICLCVIPSRPRGADLQCPSPPPFPKTHLCVLQCASLSPQPRQVGHVFLVPFPEQRPQLAQRDMLHVIDLLGLQAVRMPRQFLSQGHREHVVELVVHKGLAVKLPLFPVVV